MLNLYTLVVYFLFTYYNDTVNQEADSDLLFSKARVGPKILIDFWAPSQQHS